MKLECTILMRAIRPDLENPNQKSRDFVAGSQIERRAFGDEATSTCDLCGQAALKLKRCGRCRAAWYCSSSCQRLAWSDRKAGCFEALVAPPVLEGGDQMQVVGHVSTAEG
jgi:hypothetical protein